MPWVIAGGGGTSVTLTLSTSDEAPTSILVTRSEPTSGTLQTWSLEYKRWNDADWTLFADDLTALTQTVPDLVAYDPLTDPDPLVTPLYTFRAVGVVTIETPAATATGSTTAEPPPPPITPLKQLAWAMGSTKGSSDWAPVDPETRTTVRMMLKNISGQIMTKARVGFLMNRTPGGRIEKLFFSSQFSGLNCTSFSQMFFDGLESYEETRTHPSTSNSLTQPVYSDELVLPVPVAVNGYFVLSVVLGNGATVTGRPLTTNNTNGARSLIVAEFPRKKAGDLGNTTGTVYSDGTICASPFNGVVEGWN